MKFWSKVQRKTNSHFTVYTVRIYENGLMKEAKKL